MTQVFEVPGRLMGLNEYVRECRGNRYRGARAKRDQQDIVVAAIKAAGIRRCEYPVEVGVAWIEGRSVNGAMRDPDNIRFGLKFILDALVECRVIPNDSPYWVRRTFDHYSYNNSNPRVQVRIDRYDPKGRTIHYLPVEGVKERPYGN